MARERENNFDLLRVICAVGVIFIHVSSTYLGAATSRQTFGELYLNGVMVTCLYNALTRFAVPCFVMLSGAFLLADERNGDFRYFYKKSFLSLGLPTLVFSLLYFLYAELWQLIPVVRGSQGFSSLLKPLKNWVKGAPFYHLWYLYMLIGVYLLVPVILLFKKYVGEKAFSRTAWAFLILAVCGFWTSTNDLNWDIGASFRYVGYLLVGYELRRIGLKRKSGRRGAVLILAGLALEGALVVLRYRQFLQGVPDEALKKFSLLLPLSPLVALSSVLIFGGFACLDVKTGLSGLSSLTMYIYLFHAGVWDVMKKILTRVGYGWDNRIVIPISAALVFLISVLLSKLYLAAWRGVDKRWRVSERLCSLLRLQ